MTFPFLITIPLSPATLPLAHSLLAHLTHLHASAPVLDHPVLFVADRSLTPEQYQPLLDAAKPLFPAGGELIRTPLSLPAAYPDAFNHRFETAARHIAAARRTPWLFFTPNCVPARASWYIELAQEYRAHAPQKPMLGALLEPATHGVSQRLIAASAIYPAELPKRVFQRLIAQRNVDFERSCADLFVPLAHPSKLIWVAPTSAANALPKPPAIATLVHTARAADFAKVVRGERVAESVPAPAVAPSTVTTATATTTAAASTYYHSGNLGDVIYALAAIKLAGGGKLLLGPKQRRTSPCDKPIKEDSFALLKPLLDAQPCLAETRFADRHPGTASAFDLNVFRDRWRDTGLRAKTGISTLVRMHCHVLGVDERFRPSDPWLAAPHPIATGMFCVHRSARYRNDAFPWALILRHFARRLLFVGLPSEHAEFQRAFGRVAFFSCADFLQLARVIAGSLGFIGNQSFPCAIALALGQRVAQESWEQSPDCLFTGRPNFLTQPFALRELEAWERATLAAPVL